MSKTSGSINQAGWSWVVNPKVKTQSLPNCMACSSQSLTAAAGWHLACCATVSHSYGIMFAASKHSVNNNSVNHVCGAGCAQEPALVGFGARLLVQLLHQVSACVIQCVSTSQGSMCSLLPVQHSGSVGCHYSQSSAFPSISWCMLLPLSPLHLQDNVANTRFPDPLYKESPAANPDPAHKATIAALRMLDWVKASKVTLHCAPSFFTLEPALAAEVSATGCCCSFVV